MSDVAVMLGVPVTFTITPTGGDTVTTPGSRRWVLGPPTNAAASCASQWELQIPSTDAGQTANTYRWIGNVPYYTSAPTSYVYFGNGFVPLGGI